ncbi:MAG: YbaB/EbfC family nucleoid-associated protein [Candidatus Woesearchaeota archaeon]
MSEFPKKSLFLIVLLILFTPLITPITPIEPNLNTTLTKGNYAPGEHLLGDIKFEITGPIENQYIQADIGDVHEKIKLIDALVQLEKTYQATSPIQELYGNLNQGIIFPPSPQLIGFKAQKVDRNNIEIRDDLSVFGLASNGNYPKFPYIDLKADGSREWLHLGNLTSWESSYKHSGYLNEAQTQGERTIVAPEEYYCELINLGKDVDRVNVSVRYRLASGIQIPVYVRAFGPPGNNLKAHGTEAEECMLPPITSQNSEWASCELDFAAPRIRNSDILFCVYAKTDMTGNLFVLNIDNYGGPRTYDCEDSTDGIDCNRRLGWNYFLKINLPEYDGIFNEGIPFSEGLKSTKSSFTGKIEDYLEICNQDNQGNCIVPLEVGSQSEGIVSLPNNLIEISNVGVVFEKYREKSEILTKISTKNLTRGLNLTIPLSIIENLTAPQVPYIQILPLKITFGSKYVFTDVEINPAAISEEDPEILINNTLEKIDEYLSDPAIIPILEFLDLNLNAKRSPLQSYQTQLEDLKSNTTMNEQNKTAAIAGIRTSIISLIAEVPKELYISNEVSNLPTIPPTQVQDFYLPQGQTSTEVKDYVLSVQGLATINSRSIAYRLKTQTDQIQERTLVIRDISTSLANPYVIEDIPSSVATVSEVEYKQPVATVGSGATLKLELHLGSAKLVYQILGDVTNSLPNIRTLIVSIEGAAAQQQDGFQEAVCGDGICTIPLEDKILCPEDCKRKAPWVTIIMIILIFLILLYYINFYKGKYSFRSLFHKKKLFKSEADKINLINYIERSSIHMSIEKITKILLSKGWSKEQIDHALEQLNKKRKERTKLF